MDNRLSVKDIRTRLRLPHESFGKLDQVAGRQTIAKESNGAFAGKPIIATIISLRNDDTKLYVNKMHLNIIDVNKIPAKNKTE